MAQSMNDRLNNLDAEFEARSLAVFAQAQEDLAYTAKPFEPIETNMDPGSRVGITGDFLQPNPWTLSMQSLAADGGDTWGEDIGGSKKPVAITANLGSLMMANCYKNPSGKLYKN